MSCVELAVASIGHRVPRTDFACKVHSVFARACNFQCDDALLSLVTPNVSSGPTTLVLHRDPVDDLRALFEAGEVVNCRDGTARARRAALRLRDAVIWRPPPRRAFATAKRISDHLRTAAARLARHRLVHSSVIDRQGATIEAALRQACRELDRHATLEQVRRLVGWGEGLTPAGDDFLVGWLAGLDAMAHGDDARRRYLDALAPLIAALGDRTTPIAAHFLRQAAKGHYNEALERLRDAMLCEPRRDLLDVALDNALYIGASSGADLVSGLLSALGAWLPAEDRVVLQ